MISKGFSYVRLSEEEDVHTISSNGKEIFAVKDDYIIDAMAADEQRDTIIVVLKRKNEEAEDV